MWIDTYVSLHYVNKKFKDAKIFAGKACKLGMDKTTKQLIVKIDSVLAIKNYTTFME